MRAIPPFIVARYGSAHAFRQAKRREIKAAIEAVNAVHLGSAFLPLGSGSVSTALAALHTLRKECSVKVWGQ